MSTASALEVVYGREVRASADERKQHGVGGDDRGEEVPFLQAGD